MAQLLIEAAFDVLFHVGGGRLMWISSLIATLLGWHPEELHRQSLDELAHPGDPPPLRTLLQAATTGQRAEAEDRFKHRDGHWRWTHISLAPRRRGVDDAEAIGWMRDIQAQVEHRQEREAVYQSLAESEARYRLIAEHVVDVDLDHFKAINDNHGHPVGDTVLVESCQRSRRQLRRTDCPARWGGEEFMVLMPHCPETKGRVVAEKLRHQIAGQPIGPLRTVSASIGIAQLLEGADREHLLQRLDQALYQAKALDRNNVARAQVAVNSSSH